MSIAYQIFVELQLACMLAMLPAVAQLSTAMHLTENEPHRLTAPNSSAPYNACGETPTLLKAIQLSIAMHVMHSGLPMLQAPVQLNSPMHVTYSDLAMPQAPSQLYTHVHGYSEPTQTAFTDLLSACDLPARGFVRCSLLQL